MMHQRYSWRSDARLLACASAAVVLGAVAVALAISTSSDAASLRSGAKHGSVAAQVFLNVKTAPVSKLVGQLLIGSFEGTVPPRSILARIRAGQLGSVILFADNTGRPVWPAAASATPSSTFQDSAWRPKAPTSCL